MSFPNTPPKAVKDRPAQCLRGLDNPTYYLLCEDPHCRDGGQRVELSALGNRRVKSGIEYCDLWRRLAEDLPQCPNSAKVVGVMERREVDAVLDSLQHLIVDDDRFLE